jgi:3-oxoadipate enol-lactonase
MQAAVGGRQVRYELSGQQNRPVVMMSHSLSTRLEMWDAQMPSLEPQFRVLRYDTRGHGGSDAPVGVYTLERLSDDALGLMDVLGIEKVHWVGISMGGMIGQQLALERPDRLHSLVLSSTAAVMGEEAQPVWQERIDRARSEGMDSLVAETLQRWFSPAYLQRHPPAVEAIEQQIRSTPVEGFIGCSEAIRRLNTLDRLDQIRLPALVIVGEDDPGTPVSASEAIHQRLTGSQLEVIPAVRHLCNIEAQEVFNKLLLEFINSQQP